MAYLVNLFDLDTNELLVRQQVGNKSTKQNFRKTANLLYNKVTSNSCWASVTDLSTGYAIDKFEINSH